MLGRHLCGNRLTRFAHAGCAHYHFDVPMLTVSRALELALFMDAKLDVSKVPAK
jgi:hypothetical protein